MPRRCTVCDHPQREAIDIALVTNNAPFRAISRQFGTHKDALIRHRDGHLPLALVSAQAVREAEHGASILDQLHDLQRRTLAQLEKAEREGHKPVDVAKIIRECRENLSTLGRLLGEFPKEGTTIDNRTQILALGQLSVDELRRLASLAPTLARSRESNG